jgi:hypothetical protein
MEPNLLDGQLLPLLVSPLLRLGDGRLLLALVRLLLALFDRDPSHDTLTVLVSLLGRVDAVRERAGLVRREGKEDPGQQPRGGDRRMSASSRGSRGEKEEEKRSYFCE